MDAERPPASRRRETGLPAGARKPEVEQEPAESPSPGPATAHPIPRDPRQLKPADVLALQRLVGNSAVTRLLSADRQSPVVQRVPPGGSTATPSTAGSPTQAPSAAAAEPANLTRLRQLLDDGDEEEAITLMGHLGPGEGQRVLESPEFQRLAVSAFDNEEMYRAVRAMRTNLPLSLGWMFDEGTDWDKVSDVIRFISQGRERILRENLMLDEFVGVCDNEEMAEAVQLLGGTLRQKLKWMVAEGTDGDLVSRIITPQQHNHAELAELTTDPALMRELESQLSSREYRWLQGVLAQVTLANEPVSHASSETHYERQNAQVENSPWVQKTFNWTTEYDIFYTASLLRIIVKIKLTGEPAPDDKRSEWLDGIRDRWNGHYHIEDGRTLGISFEPSFVESGEHHSVRVHAGDGRADAANWYLGTSDGDTAAHEFGHLVGLEDEYRLTAADYRRVVEAEPPPGDVPAQGYTNPGLMTHGGGAVQGRHLRPFLAWLNQHRLRGERPYRLVEGGS